MEKIDVLKMIAAMNLSNLEIVATEDDHPVIHHTERPGAHLFGLSPAEKNANKKKELANKAAKTAAKRAKKQRATNRK